MAESYNPLKPLPNWSEDEKPFAPGSPSTPAHPFHVRIAYGCIGILLGITSGLGMALITINLPGIQGDMGLTPTQGALSSAAYVTANCCANLLIFKFRQQFGVRAFAEVSMSVYCLTALLHLMVNDLSTAMLVRFASGFAGAAMSVMCMFYMIQAFPKKHRGKAIVISLGTTQLAMPLAGILSPLLIDNGQWHILYQFEAGLALCALAAVFILKLPPSIHIKVLERQDIPTILMILPGNALLVAVLSQGVLQWWTDAAWIGWALVASFLLIGCALFYEWHRSNPMIHVRWMLQPATINFGLGALTLRFLISEQNYGAVSMLKLLGMGPDQLQVLYVVIFFGVLAGILCSAILFQPKLIFVQTFIALLLIAAGSFMDTHSTSLTRPHNMFLSQFMIAVACGMFLGPMMLLGFMQVYKGGKHYIISFAILFSLTQNMGSVIGQAIFGTYQLVREREYSALIVSGINPVDPQVTQRLQRQSAAYAPLVTDPVLRQAQGAAQLAQAARREANVRAYNDVYLLVAGIAAIFLIWSLFNLYLAFKNAIKVHKITRLRRKLIIHAIRQYQHSARHKGRKNSKGRRAQSHA